MSNSLLLRWIVLLICLLSAADGIAQQNLSRHNWYFGNTTRGIRFSRSTSQPALVNNKVIPFGTGGSAVASSPINGDLLFYTDGSQIYDITHATMFGSPILLPAPVTTNQPVAISGRPGFPNQYYVFTNNANFTTGGSIAVTTVDMSLQGNAVGNEPPIGQVSAANVATGITGRSEGMVIVPHADGTRFWLITHQNNSDIFSATLIDGSGVFPAPTLSPGITGFPMSAANFSYHAATNKLAVSPQTDNRNVAILNFDNTTGAMTLDRLVLTSGVNSTGNQAIYDTEWSPSGRFLYISTHGETGITANVVQFDMTAPAGTSLVSVLDIPVSRSFGLMIAPDTAIYHLYQTTPAGPFLLGRLTDLDSVGIAVAHTPDAFGGAINFNGRQFPEFLPRGNNNLTVSFTSQGLCANSPVSFFPTVSPAADSLVWSFGDGNNSSDWSPIHTYENGGNFNVSVTAYLNGQASTPGTGVVSLTDFTLQLTLPADTTACRCEFPPPIGGSCNPFSVRVRTEGGTAPFTFNWSNGDTGATLTPDSAGYYYVVVTDATGCSTYAGVNVREYDGVDQRANIWYFGQRGGIDFNQQPPVPITGPLNTPEGCSVISDRNGEVIFSTDGVRVYDKNDVEITTTLVGGVPTPIPIPPGIGGEQGSTQSALIMPVQGDETIFYIFTTQEVHGSNTYELRYSLYDIKLNGGNGGLVEYNKLLFSRSTERITGNEQFLVAHEYGNNSFRAYPISVNGIGNPIISSLGSDHMVTEELQGQGYMELNGNLLAVAFSTSNTNNFIEVFDFVDTTGIVSNFRRVDLLTNSPDDPGQVYGIEIVGNKILATIRGTSASFLKEVYMDFQNNPVLVPASANPPSRPAELGAIQTGPDGTIYVAVNNSPALATIALNADTLQISNVTLNSFPLVGGTQSRLGLPNFIQEIFTGTPDPSMTITGLCGGSPTRFAGVGTDQIDVFLWSFGDGFTADSANVEHTYPIPPPGTTQDYFVTLRISNRCGLDTLLTQTITISGPPPNPTFLPPGAQPSICRGPLTLQALPANDPTFTYLWSTGETTFNIVVTRTQIVDVTITNAAGCTSRRDLLITDNRPIIELGPNQNVCQNTPVAPLDAQNPGAGTLYAWAINEIPSGTTRTQAVNTGTPGLFEYRVQVTDPITNCFGKDSVVFTINPSPAFTAIPNTIVCGTNNGQIQLTITGPAGGTFSYSVVGLTSGLSQSNIDQTTGPVVPSPITGLVVDTYVVEVADQLSGCATTTSVGINSTSLSISNLVAQTPTCNPVALEFDASIAPGTYRVINSVTGAVVINTTAYAATHVITPPVPVPGQYIVEIRQGACTSTAPISVVSDPQVTVTLTADPCANPITLSETSAPLGSTYVWSGPGINNINSANTTAVPPAQGPQIYTVTVTSPGLCPTTQSITVNVNNNVIADFTQSDACANNVTLTATTVPATGSYTYRWYRAGTLIPGGGGQTIQLTLADNGIDYRVEVVNTVSGCVFSSPTKIADVFGDIVVFIDPVSPCAGDVFSIEATDIPGATYEWFLNGNPILGQTAATLTGQTSQGTYSVIATSSNGCPSDEVSGEVRFVASPAGNLPAKKYICNQPGNRDCTKDPPDNETCLFQLRAGDGISWQWFKDGVELAGETQQTYEVSEPGLYSVEIINAFECLTVDQTLVVLQCQPLIELPNAFRPAGDQLINRTFSVHPYQTFVSETGFQVFIYNRWGEMVYQSNNMRFEWNGRYKGTGELLPGGTYTYVIKYFGSLTDAGQQELRGGVMLLR